MAAVSHPASDLAVSRLAWSQDLQREHGFEPLAIEGTLPPALRGTLYRNGPGLFGQFGTRYGHPFEADGAVTAIRIADGKATGAARVTQSAGLREERATGELRYGMSAPWLRRVRNVLRGRRKNTANTSVMVWQGRLFALMEAARPTEIATRDLTTIGSTSLGVIRAMFSAHPHRVEARRTIYNFGLEYGRHNRIHLYALPDAGPVRHLGAVELAGPPMLHDFIATENHLVFFVSPVRVDVPRMLTQVGTFEQLFRWQPQHGTEIVCVPIDRPSEVVRFTTDAFYQWHFANAFERDRELVVDYVRYANFDSFHALGQIAHGATLPGLTDGRYHRATIDLRARTLRSMPVSDRPCEFPTLAPGIHGREHELAYVVLDDFGALGSIDARGTIVAHAVARDERITEPVVAAGHLLALVHTRDRAYVAVYNAARIPDGPVARIWLDHSVPITFHGVFAPAT